MFKGIYSGIQSICFKNKSIFKLLFIQIIFLLIFVYGYILVVDNDVYKVCFKQGTEGNVSAILENGDIVKQQIFINDSINGISVLFAAWGNEVTDGTIKIELLDENQETHYESIWNATEIKDNQYIEIEFDPIPLSSRGEIYTLCMTFDDIEDQTISFWMTDNHLYDDVDFILNNESSAADMVISERINSHQSRFLYAYIVVMALLFAIITASYFMICKFKLKIQHIYAFVAFFFGLIYMTNIPVGVAPDELFHMYSAYSISNSILGIEDNSTDGTIMMRSDDAEQVWDWLTGDRPYYRIENRQFQEEHYALYEKVIASDCSIVGTTCIPVYTYSYLYFFSGLGITLGRMLNLSVSWTFLLGRLFNFLIFLGGTFYAIKKIPFGKTIIFILGLLPITLQQAASFSYDASILALSAIVTSLSLKLAFDSETKYQKSEELLLFISAILLAPAKLLALTPLCLLPAIILFKNPKKRKYVLCMMFTMIIIVILFNIEPINDLVSVGNKNISHMYLSDDMGYDLGDLLANPKQTFLIICNTVYETWDFIFETFLGRRLGHYEIILPMHVLIPYFILLIFAALKHKDEPQYLNKQTRVFFFLIALIGYGFASGGMLLSWTRTNVQHIDGVQGRYLLPFATLAFLALRNEAVMINKKIDNELIFDTIFLETLSAFCIFRFFF